MKSSLYRVHVTVLLLLVLLAGRGVADEIFLEDVIIKPYSGEGGHLAIGSQAVSDQVFSPNDKILLKDFVVRIFFDDASDPEGVYPANDWRILINDPTDTGTSFFGVEDATATNIPFRIAAGAPEDSMNVATNGFLGIGTQSPTEVIHAVSDNTPAIRLEQDGTLGLVAQSWDLGGNATHFLVRDHTNGDTVPFSIGSGSPANQLVVTPGGISIGIATPLSNNVFHVNASLPDKRVLIGAGDSGVTKVLLNVDGAGYFRGDLEVGSSRALKDDITALEPAAARDALQALEPIRFRYKDSSEAKIGFIAEDVPDLVATETRKSLSPMDLIGVLTSVVKEQQEEITRLSDRLEVIEQSLPQPPETSRSP